MDAANMQLMSELCAAIERAWSSNHDEAIVHRLAAEYPQLSEELYEFFADVVAMTLQPDEARPELTAVDDRMRDWLERQGFQEIAAAHRRVNHSATPTSSITPAATAKTPSIVALLKSRSQKPVDGLAASLRITPAFLIDLSDHPDVVPERARRELARRAQEALAIEQNEIEVAFRTSPGAATQRAASRSKVFERKEISYEAMVRRSKLDDDERRFWLSLA